MKTTELNIPDNRLIESCKAGDPKAFEQLVKRYYQKAYSIALLQLRNREAALDISQEVFVRIHRNIGKFDTNKSFAAWLYIITRNVCRNYAKRFQRRWTVFSDIANSESILPENKAETPVEALENQERKEFLWKSIQALSETDREIIQLKDIEEFSYKEISEALDIPIGSVMSRLYYARKRLGKMIRAEI